MTVKIVDRPELDGVDVYVYEQVGDQRHPLALNGGPHSEHPEPLPPSYELPRSAFIRHDVYAELRLAMIGETTLATEDALADCREVRDRMISLVERGWDG